MEEEEEKLETIAVTSGKNEMGGCEGLADEEMVRKDERGRQKYIRLK